MKRGLEGVKKGPSKKRSRVLPLDVVGFIITSLNNTGLKVGAPYDSSMVKQMIYDNPNSVNFLRSNGFTPKPPDLTLNVFNHLQALISRDIIHVDGVVLKVVNDRAAVLFDISFTSFTSLASHRKDRSMAFVLNHLSCNWNLRRLLMVSPDAINDEYVLRQPFCHVLGCALHPLNPIPADFNVCNIITGLPTYEPEIGKGITASKLGTGIWDLPDHVLRIICSKLTGESLHKFGRVCKHTRLVTSSMLPTEIEQKLSLHQETSLQWMFNREMYRKFANPMYKRFESKTGKFVYGNCIQGDLTTVEPVLVEDIRGGIVSGADKMAIILSLIYKTKFHHSNNGTLVIVPTQEVGNWWRDQIHNLNGLSCHIFRGDNRGRVSSDVVIVTFGQLSCRWGKEDVIQDVEWFRIIVDESHTLQTLGESSTKKARMAIALSASRRWILTGTTDIQPKQLRTWLKVLHDDLYSKRNTLTPVLECFEDEQYEGKVQIVKLLQRCMYEV